MSSAEMQLVADLVSYQVLIAQLKYLTVSVCFALIAAVVIYVINARK